jgi:hypothetical protein
VQRDAGMVGEPGPERYRSRQAITVGRDTPSCLAIAEVPSPAPALSTMRARRAVPAVREAERVQANNSVRSASGISRISADRSMAHCT